MFCNLFHQTIHRSESFSYASQVKEIQTLLFHYDENFGSRRPVKGYLSHEELLSSYEELLQVILQIFRL